MKPSPALSRRRFLSRTGSTLASGLGLALAGPGLRPARGATATVTTPATATSTTDPMADVMAFVRRIEDPVIRAGMEAAITKNLVPAASERVYPGHFTINADGGGFGADTTWPGLDSWQMTGAYLQLGRTRMVLDYFEFVRASQRRDGNIPFAIFNGDTRPGGCLRGLKYPEDVFTYTPPVREDLPPSSRSTRSWIGLFEHWQTQGFPLSTLGPICYLLTAAEIFDHTHSRPWLEAHLDSLDAAARHLLTRRNELGLIGGSGFYMEAPPREDCDGVTQGYSVHAFRGLSRLARAAGDRARAARWSTEADHLAKAFRRVFWRGDHFGEYLHPRRGLVDSHGLSDVNWAAIAFGLIEGRNLRRLRTRLLDDPGFWVGGMPTQVVTKPFAYEPWESSPSSDCGVEPFNDIAAMGRVWYLEALALQRLGAADRLVDSVRKVCQAALPDGFWRERYHPKPDGTVSADGSRKYCEYAAVLVRVVLGNRPLFDGTLRR